MRAVIYTRASLDRTGEGKSNARQEEECERLCDYKRWEIVNREADISISAYGKKERPGWLAVLAAIEAGEVDVVVAYHLDRLTRNMGDLEKLILLCEAHNVSVATATGDLDLTNDTGRMVARILAAVARQEVERKAARQKLAHAQRRSEGRPWEAVKMLGYTHQGEVIDHEADAIRRAMKDAVEERKSLRAIGQEWLELGLDSPYRKDKTKPWTPRAVKMILTNPRIAGFVTHDGEVLGKGNWEPLVSETDFTIAVAKLNAPERTNGQVKTGRLAANLLTGIMVCSKCGGSVRASVKRDKETYTCGSWHTDVPKAEADALVRSSVAAAVALTRTGSILGAASKRVDAVVVSEEIERLRQREEVLARSFARGVTSESAYEGAIEEIQQQIDALEAEVKGQRSDVDWRSVRAESVTSFLSQDMAEQRRVLERIATITMHPANRRPSSAKRQVEVILKGKRGETDIEIPAHVPSVLTDA